MKKLNFLINIVLVITIALLYNYVDINLFELIGFCGYLTLMRDFYYPRTPKTDNNIMVVGDYD